MNALYIDTEFNGFGGSLITLALANPTKTGKDFYGRLPDPPKWDKWVAENVVPNLDIEPESPVMFRHRLRIYLQARQPVAIYADYPGDFWHLTNQMLGPSFDEYWSVDCAFVMLNHSDPKPVVAHNALSDAIALMEWHKLALDRGEYRSGVVTF